MFVYISLSIYLSLSLYIYIYIYIYYVVAFPPLAAEARSIVDSGRRHFMECAQDEAPNDYHVLCYAKYMILYYNIP